MDIQPNARRVWALAAFSTFVLPTLFISLAAGQAWAANPAASSNLPPSLRPALYQALAKDAGPAFTIGRDGCATLPKQSLTACFDKSGAHFSSANAPELALHLTGYDRGNHLTTINPVAPAIGADRANYAHGNVTEWWRVLPVGFEQGFTLAKRPVGHGKLMLALAANGKAKQQNGTLAWGRLHYGGLVITDAKGKVVPATLKTKGDRILIAVNDAHATYPLTVDPLVWIEQKKVSNDGETNDNFGYSVAVSGSTAIIGAPGATIDGIGAVGAAYIFTETNGIWSETQKLAASVGTYAAEFGSAVSINGDSALIGAPYADINGNTSQGAAYIFSKENDTWAQIQELTANDGVGDDNFGYSVALSGTTALVGAFRATVGNNTGQGAAYVFTQSGGVWDQTQKLTASNGGMNDSFGTSAALDETTAVIGATGANAGKGAAYVFTDSGGMWSEGQELIPNDGTPDDLFGYAGIALQGTTVFIGANDATVGNKTDVGGVYVFDESGGTWSQVQKISSNDGASGDGFGYSIALDGTTALIGALNATVGANPQQGVVYLFEQSGTNWVQTIKLTASDGAAYDNYGYAVALSGTIALVGSDSADVGSNINQGAGYFEGGSDLGLAMSVPAEVSPGSNFVSQTIATNNASAASPAVSVTVTVPAAASFVSADATQGTCSEASDVVTCAFGAINGNAGTATANVTLKVPGGNAVTFQNTASVVNATPPLTASAATTITPNSPPVASNGTLTTNENTPASGTLKAVDPDGDPLTFSVVTKPSHGSVTLDDINTGAYTYTPNHNYSGSDSFTFKANDGQVDSNVAKISITVKSAGGGGSSGGGSIGLPTLFALLGLALMGAYLKGKRG